MPVSLQKGQKVSLTKDNPGLKKVVVDVVVVLVIVEHKDCAYH